VTSASHPDEFIATRGARWITAAFLAVGILNYGYALVLTRLLSVDAYTRFGAGQGLLLWAATVATVSVPWVLAQSLARARSDAERAAAIRFAMMASAGTGLIAGTVIGLISTGFAGPAATLALAVSTFVIFLGTPAIGWLQGRGHMRTLSALTVGETLVKITVGLLLVTVAGLAATGALAAFGIGALLLLPWWPPVPRGSGRPWRASLANRDLWHRALGIAGVQGLVTLLTAIDVVLVTLLPASRATVASYQASAAVSRVPLFVASAVATAFFPALSKRATGGALATKAVRMYAIVALPLTAVLVTVPARVLAVAFPPQYAAMATLLKFTAAAGLAVGGINLVTTFFQAADDYSCLWWQGVGLVGYVAALLAGWWAGGITGLAVGAALSAWAALGLLGYRFVRRQGRGLLARVRLAEPIVATVLLVLLRPYPLVWLVAATLVGLRAGAVFLRRSGSRDERVPAGAAPGQRRKAMRHIRNQPAVTLLTDAVWRGRVRDSTIPELQSAMAVAFRNQVEGRLARAYPEQLSYVLTEVQVANDLFARNLHQVTGRLQQAGIPSVLIKADLPGECVHVDFDLVVRDWQWEDAVKVLSGWYVHRSTYWLERSTKAHLYPLVGPALHLHASVSWFGIPVLPTDRLLACAHQTEHGCLAPAPADHLRIWLAHALFQNLALDLSELFAVRDLLRPEVIKSAHEEAGREGWLAGFGGALAVVDAAIDRLDRGVPLGLPVPLPVSLSLRAGAEHAYHLLRAGQTRVAAREAALRLPLVLAKRRRVRIV